MMKNDAKGASTAPYIAVLSATDSSKLWVL